MDRSPSTISREIKRNTGLRGYRHQQSDRMALIRHGIKPKHVKLTLESRSLIDTSVGHWEANTIIGNQHNGVL